MKAKRVEWLTFEPQPNWKGEELSYSYKGPLTAASFTLKASRGKSPTENQSEFDLVIEASAEARIPLRRWSLKAKTILKTSGKAMLPSSYLQEGPSNGERIEWLFGAETTNINQSNGPQKVLTREALEVLPAPIFDPLTLLFSLGPLTHLSSTQPTAGGAYLAAGSRLSALAFEPLGEIDRQSVESTFDGRMLTIDRPLSAEHWLQLPWQEAKKFQVRIDKRSSRVSVIRLETGLLGSIEVRLTGRKLI